MRRLVLSGVMAFGMVLGGTATAYAGETNGTGGPVPAPDQAASECAFSGLDQLDSIEHNPPGFDDDAISLHGVQRVQSYGIFVSNGLKAFVPSPGEACRGSHG